MKTRAWFASLPSVGEVLDRTRGIGQGFNFLRIALAVGVIYVHSYQTAYGFGARSNWLGTGPLAPIVALILIMFFGLSGFLITGSAVRTGNLPKFLSFRAIRLVPALFVEVLVSAFIMGLLLTSFRPSAYFGSKELWVYFGNIVGWIHYSLPGVFLDNPAPNLVNRSLWTLHPELACYGLMSGFIITKLVKSRAAMTAGLLGLGLLLALAGRHGRFDAHGNFPAPVLVYYFVAGIVAFHWRHSVKVHFVLFLLALTVCYALVLVHGTVWLMAAPVLYMVMYIGITPFPKWALIERGDYSYGMYLYSYPLEQTWVHLFPAAREWHYVFMFGLIGSYTVASLSWHFIEKPTLNLKKRFGGKVMQESKEAPHLPLMHPSA